MYTSHNRAKIVLHALVACVACGVSLKSDAVGDALLWQLRWPTGRGNRDYCAVAT